MPDTFMVHTHAHETRPKTKVTVVVIVVVLVLVVSRQCKIRVKCAKRAARAEIAERRAPSTENSGPV